MNKLIFSILLACLAAFSCNNAGKNPEAEGETTNSIADLPPMEVEVMVLKRGSFNKEITSNGKITAQLKVELRLPVTSKIKRIYKKNGNRVQKGEVIAELDTYETRIKLGQTKARFGKARIDLADVLVSQGFSIEDTAKIPREMLDIAKIRSGYLQAEADYEIAKLELSNTVLTAPNDGVLANIAAQEMNLNKPGEPFGTLLGDNVETVFTVLESELPMVKVGQNVSVSPYFEQNKKIKGTIVEINPIVDKNGLVTVKARLQSGHTLFEGMNVKITIQTSINNRLVVPKTAVTPRSEKKVVFTCKNGKALWNYVTTGLENSTSYTIEDGLRPGDTVIVSGGLHMGDQAPVVILGIKNYE